MCLLHVQPVYSTFTFRKLDNEYLIRQRDLYLSHQEYLPELFFIEIYNQK